MTPRWRRRASCRDELHEYANGPQRTLLFRVRYGADMLTRRMDWRGNPAFKQSAQDVEYFRQNAVADDKASL